jgi:cell wall-associated NlpC family hydrolase
MNDPRLTPARGDIAARFLQGKVAAARFVDGETSEIAASIAPLREKPVADATLLTQAIRGETATIYDRNGEGFAWGQLDSDGYVGWLPDTALARPAASPTHKVTALSTFAFPGPSIKLPPIETLVMGSRLTVIGEKEMFAVTGAGFYVPKRHLAGLNDRASDFVEVAERFIGTPYLWGGKSSLGIDCSGLVQVALTTAGVGCPRDSDMQQDALGRLLDTDELHQLFRGDLLFWKGHVAIARDANSIVHANAFHMATVVENTQDAIARIKHAGNEVVAIKRLQVATAPLGAASLRKAAANSARV